MLLAVTGGLSQPPGLTLGFEKAEDVVLADRSLHVADNGTGLVIHEFDTNLSNTTTRTSTAQDSGNFDKLDGLLRGIHDI